MDKPRKIKWEKRAKCGCVKATLAKGGKVMVRCAKHRGRRAKTGRTLCYFDDAGQVQIEA